MTAWDAAEPDPRVSKTAKKSAPGGLPRSVRST
jgi:hypothetical protein